MAARTKNCLLTVVTSILIVWVGVSDLHAVDISDLPLETLVHTAPPNIVFILDNSGSMDVEFMTSRPLGLFQKCYYLFPDEAYRPHHDHKYGDGHALNASQRRMWRSQWVGENRIYYTPHRTYHPWPATSKYDFGASDPNLPLSNPAETARNSPRLRLSAEFFSVRSGTDMIQVSNAHYFTHDDANGNGQLDSGENVYLVTWVDSDKDRRLDVSGELDRDRRRYYRLMDDADGKVEDNELILITDNSEKNRIRPIWTDIQGQSVRYKTDSEDLQNFANWFSYHRRRALAAKAAAAEAIRQLERVYIGLYAVNGSPRIAVQPVKIESGDNARGARDSDRTEYLLNALYAMDIEGTTPLRRAIDQIGRYFHQDQSSTLGRSPFTDAEHGGACQRSCTVVITDGFWNGSFSGLGNVDGDNGRPYADGWVNTFADIAMYYYENDLAPDLEDRLPATACDDAIHQHMNTYILSFGIQTGFDGIGHHDDAGWDDALQGHVPCSNQEPVSYPVWPRPESLHGKEFSDRSQGGSLIYDMWHAAVNGRGRYMSIASPEVLIHALPQMMTLIGDKASAASPAVDGARAGTVSMVFQTRYDTDNWSGDVLAYPIHMFCEKVETGEAQALWSAADQLEKIDVNWDNRRIITYGGNWGRPQGVPFRYSNLSAGQLKALGSDLMAGSVADDNAADVLEFIRGRRFSKFNSRQNKLGDIVHSAPALFENTLFVGANDGMLHAFDARTGHERFAYVPSLVFNHLKMLSDENYNDHHRFFVDATPYVGDVEVGLYQRHTYLTGGLGKGGKGYYCMLVGVRERPSAGDGFGDYQWTFNVDEFGPDTPESDIGRIVRWEYPGIQTADDGMDNDNDGLVDETDEIDSHMGYSFSQAYVVNANAPDGNYRPVVIFGNGYNSDHQRAVLYVLTADDGRVLRKIDTGCAKDNGLSTPALVDINLDRRVDYVYAGDLNGHLWKFDLTSIHPSQWGVAYGEDLTGDGVIDAAHGDDPKPLFSAPGQPITGRPDVMAMRNACAVQAPGFMVIFGTGRFLGASDRFDRSQQSIYGIWDYGDDGDDSEYLGHITNRSTGRLSCGYVLQRQEVVGQYSSAGNMFRELSDIIFEYNVVEDFEDQDGYNNFGSSRKKGNPQYFAGWFIDFPLLPDPMAQPGERVTGPAAIRNGKSIIVSFVPDNTPCVSGNGASWLYVLDGCYGTAPLDQGEEPLNPKRFEGKINDGAVIFKDTTRIRFDQILFSDHTGRIMKESFKGEKWGQVFWRQNIDR